MKKILLYIWQLPKYLLGLLFLLLLASCTIVEVIDIAEPEPELTPMMQMQKDTTARDTTEKKDTIRIPIGFEVGVDGWEEEDVEI